MNRFPAQQSEDQSLYRDLFETSPDPIFIEDEDGVVLDVNEAACRFQGMPREELVGANVLDLVPQAQRSRVQSDFRQWITGEMTSYRGFASKPQGGMVPVEIHGVRVQYLGKPAVILHVRDRSEQHKQQEDYEQIFREMLTGFALHEIILDDQGTPVNYRFLAVNPAFEAVVGLPATALIGRTVLEVFPRVEPYWIEVYGRVALSGNPEYIENYSQVLDKYFEVSAYSPAPGQFACIIYDATRRHKALAALRRREDYGRALLKAIPDSMFIFARDGSCQDARDQLVFDTRHEPPASSFHQLSDLGLSEAAQQQWRESLSTCLDSSRVRLITYAREDLLGTTWWEAVFAPMNREQALVICREVTARVLRAEQDAQREREIVAAQNLESLGVLAGGIAHDFNNLLVGVMGNADLALMQANVDESIRDYLEEIKLASRRASELTQLMLAYSGRASFHRREIRVNELIRETFRLVSSALSRQIDVQLELADALPDLMGDATQLRQLFMNLFTNASDAIGSHPGKIVVRSAVATLPSETFHAVPSLPPVEPGVYVVLEIVDTGCGIEPSQLPRIFEPFFTTKFTGRGLGLAAALGIVRSHQGSIALKSTPGEGTSIRVALPVPEAQISGDPASATAVSNSVKSGVAQHAGVVLVVDDEDTVRKVIHRVLARIGFEVREAEHGRAALDVLQQVEGQVRLMLLDLTMPEMDGEDTLKALKETGSILPVLLMSGYSETEAAERFGVYSVRGYIEKPFEINGLRDKVLRAIAG